MKRFLIVVFAFVLFLTACNKKEQKQEIKKTTTANINLRISYRPIKKAYKPNEEVHISVRTNSQADSIILFFGSKKISTSDSSALNVKYTLPNQAGAFPVKAKAFKNGKIYTSERKIRVLSPVKPEILTYKIVNTYPHDPHAYTQGLLYQDDLLYESTGQKGESSIRKVKLQTGEIIQSFSIESDIFGEGITIWKDKIIQLSWQARKGFVYDKNSFALLQEFYYSTEGWGLTNNDTALIMSDGTNRLFFLNPETFAVEKTIEIFDDKKPVMAINELEFINGKIYANIFMTDTIAVINPQKGIVQQYVNMQGLLNKTNLRQKVDVLNGIAYDKKNDRIFVTGKYWPKLFEVKFIKQ